ncbi:single-stranded-DNA-specific exonuclease RecJ [Hypericibacter adhaerens]|uniref:Single-stranded-DNA-specific exonuclease RecJ n=1 Tax=Hypericibacter adhaerens TaxID=2602016 RepID=A0A5J6MZ64_9PROT|nr:single-stranded-DNA-specific exonuclease RecJ [Hypericibacter adhaerens]QEX22621.1 single-stranded-DNA-specific exonuclease RecJ [Hypericibacter adhaerens]
MTATATLSDPAVPSAAFLGVERSVSGKRWRVRLSDERLGLMLAQRHGLPEIVGRVLAARGIGADEVPGFLEPRLRDQLPDPSRLKDMDRAVARLVQALVQGQRIAVFGDYDVDGATSSALLQRFFAAIGHPIERYIPDRLSEGYGPNLPALLKLRERGIDLVITVDCGITAHEPLEGAVAAGLEVIVIDHHKAEPRLPAVAAVVDPNRLDEPPGLGQLAAVGVAFLLVVALNRALRAASWYGADRPEPDLLQWLDLVALGTVADVVPLTGINRALVTQGIKVLGKRANAGLAALSDVARLEGAPSAYHLGFLLGPRVNAGGRVAKADLGARLLSTMDATEAKTLAAELDGFNRERQQIEMAVLEQAIAAVEQGGGRSGDLVFCASAGWHPGVIGIVASRLKDRYNRPAFVVALEGGIGKGSGRSVPGFDLGSAVLAARQAGLLVNGGGHAMAAGLTVEEGKLGALRDFLAGRVADHVGDGALVPELGLDGALQPGAATVDLMNMLERLAPFGSGNAEPRFALPAVRVVKADPVGENHLRCILAGGGSGRLKAIAFRARDNEIGRALAQTGSPALHIAGHLRADRWNGREDVQFVIEDVAAAGQ